MQKEMSEGGGGVVILRVDGEEAAAGFGVEVRLTVLNLFDVETLATATPLFCSKAWNSSAASARYSLSETASSQA